MNYKALAIAGAISLLAGVAHADPITPSFADGLAGWVTDRYAPSTVSLGNANGRSNVLTLGITDAGALANRTPGQQTTFYNTQGLQHAVTGGSGSVLEASLWVSSDWSNPANGARRTDLWGVLNDSSGIADYAIIGFTNTDNLDGGNAPGGHFQIWDDGGTTGSWVALGAAVNYDAWNDLSIVLTDNGIEYFINGALAYTDDHINGATDFSAAIIEAYNFGDPASFPGVAANDYVAQWSNVPEPGSLALLGTGLVGFVAVRRRKAAKA